MSDQDEKQTTEESGSPLVGDLVGLGRLPRTNDMGWALSEINRMFDGIRRLFEEDKRPRAVNVTEFGSLFIRACIPENFDVADWGKAPASMAEPSPEESS